MATAINKKQQLIDAITFKILILNKQIGACLREIYRGIKSYIDRLVILEDELEKLNEQLAKEMTPEISKFKVGNVYTATSHKEFSIKITRRTEKTVWFECMFKGEVGDFCSVGKKRVQCSYGRETVEDGLWMYEAGIASYAR